MFPREFKNWKYKMQVGTTLNYCYYYYYWTWCVSMLNGVHNHYCLTMEVAVPFFINHRIHRRN